MIVTLYAVHRGGFCTEAFTKTLSFGCTSHAGAPFVAMVATSTDGSLYPRTCFT